MKNNYKLTYQLTAYVVVLGLSLQSCAHSFSQVGSQIGPQEETKTSETSVSSNQIVIHPLVGHELTAERGCLVSFHEHNGLLQADIRVDKKQKKPNYKNIPVAIENGANVLILPYLSEQAQQNCIQIKQPSNGHPRQLYILQRGLKGGMMKVATEQGDQKEIGLEKTRRHTVQTNLSELPAEIWEHALSYLNIEDLEKISRLCKLFFDFATNPTPRNKFIIEEKDFQELTTKPISRFELNYLIRKVKNLSQTFWPYLQGTKVEVIDLSNNNIGALGVSKLVQVVPNTQVHTLNLGHNNVDSEGATKLIDMLPHSKILTLNLENNNIGPEGAIKLAETLPYLNTHTLYLSSNGIGNKGATKLAGALPNSNIHTLDLSYNHIRRKGAIKLAEALPNSSIHTLDLSYNHIGRKGATKLAEALPNSNIHTLDLGYNHIGHEGAIKLAKALPNSNIHTLNLSQNNIALEGTIKLAEALPNSSIHTLDLSWNHIDLEGAIRLAEVLPNSNIHTLDLSYNHIGYEGAIKLVEALPNSKMQKLDLSENNISEDIESLSKEHFSHIQIIF